jgi:hypothetical protein
VKESFHFALYNELCIHTHAKDFGNKPNFLRLNVKGAELGLFERVLFYRCIYFFTY